MEIKSDQILDAKGLACPMPIVKTRKMMKDLSSGQVLEVQATDKGSTADLKAWSDKVGHDYLGTIEIEGVLNHYLRKTTDAEQKEENKHPHVVNNEELKKVIDENDKATIIDVREQAEYFFNHIPGAVSVPLNDLDKHIDNFNKTDELYIVCRSGNRSDLVAQKLTEKGFENVKNVVPGMNDWKYETKGLFKEE